MDEISIRPIGADEPGLSYLLGLSDEYMAGLYPAESNHMVTAASLTREGNTLFGAFVGDRLVGCAGLKVCKGYGEIKRLFVLHASRSRGIARQLMTALENFARDRGLDLLRLEVGTRQPEAERLYRSLGFFERPPFGDYRDDRWSLFMEKKL